MARTSTMGLGERSVTVTSTWTSCVWRMQSASHAVGGCFRLATTRVCRHTASAQSGIASGAPSCGAGRRGGGLAVRGLVGAQHRREALHHGGVELLGGHVAELLHRGAVVNHHLVAAANRIGSGHARDGAPAPPLGVPRAVPALVAVDEGVHGAAAPLVGPCLLYTSDAAD